MKTNREWGQSRPVGEAGNVIVGTLMIVLLVSAGLGTYMGALRSYRHMEEQQLLQDRSLMAAEAGLALSMQKLVRTDKTTATDTWTLTPKEDFAPFDTVVVTTTSQDQPGNLETTYTFAASTVSSDTRRGVKLGRRVQATVKSESFAKYELFINEYGGVYFGPYYSFIGAGTVFMGPVNINSGVAFWPNMWALQAVSSAAPKGVRYFANVTTYANQVKKTDDTPDAWINVVKYWSETYKNEPKFYGGLYTLKDPIDLPDDMKTDVKAKKLRESAGLKIPASYPGFNSSKGRNFAIELSKDSPGNGKITIRQYLGNDNKGKPTYGSALTKTVSEVNGAIILEGNIVSLKGTTDGNLTIGAFRSSNTAGDGNVSITGNLEYESRKSDTDFEYTDAPGVFTSDGGNINMSYVQTLQSQLDNVNDILGIVAEGDVMVKEKDLDGGFVGKGVNTPMYIDAVVMATGASTAANSTDGGFGVENFKTRAAGQAYFLGGMIENRQYDWAEYTGSGIKNGVGMTQLWDKRAAKVGGAPPFFPTTGSYEVVPNSWRSSFIKSTSEAVVLP